MLKYSVLFNFIFLLALACSMGSPKVRIIRDEKDKLYRACEEYQVPGGQALGRFCSQRCLKKEKNQCKEWKTTVKNYCEADGYSFVKNGSFVLIPEQYL